ncbi:hypothetical protein [Arthrobacter sp. RCC_34]|uniref:hypothetical protein n=1 Tax=Arthrobacter sp. RCC_34 TaxID=3239230 RepID=UPI0035267D9F
MIVHLTVQDAVLRAAEEAAMGAGRARDQHEFFRYVSGAGEDFGVALEAARAAVPPGFSLIIIRRFEDGLAPEIPAELDASKQPIRG